MMSIKTRGEPGQDAPFKQGEGEAPNSQKVLHDGTSIDFLMVPHGTLIPFPTSENYVPPATLGYGKKRAQKGVSRPERPDIPSCSHQSRSSERFREQAPLFKAERR